MLTVLPCRMKHLKVPGCTIFLCGFEVIQKRIRNVRQLSHDSCITARVLWFAIILFAFVLSLVSFRHLTDEFE